MTAFSNQSRQVHTLPGLTHRTLAGRGDGLFELEVWEQTLEPDAASPVHYHTCEEVVVILSGTGRLLIDRNEQAVEPGTTLVVPAGVVHQLKSDGPTPMHLIAALSETPGNVYSPDGTLIPVPWLTDENE